MQNSKQKINKPNTQKFKGENNQKKMDYLEHRNIHATKSIKYVTNSNAIYYN